MTLNKTDVIESYNLCVLCGQYYVPEGSLVCPLCKKKINEEIARREAKWGL